MTLTEQVLAGDFRAAARLISRLEDNPADAAADIEALYRHTGKASIIGVTGAPGTGKSSLVNGLTAELRSRDNTVGIVAIDPSSAATGGALLGDRVRIQEHSTDPGVFIRSLATRGWAGGLSRAALGAVHVLDALGLDVIFIETVGAGQVEVDITAAADTTLVVLNPGTGDDIQTLKAGILEASDIFVVNKADRDGAEQVKAGMESMLAMRPADSPAVPVLLTSTVDGRGMGELLAAVEEHLALLNSTGGLAERRNRRTRLELAEALEAAWRKALMESSMASLVEETVRGITAGKITLNQGASRILGRLSGGLHNGNDDRQPRNNPAGPRREA